MSTYQEIKKGIPNRVSIPAELEQLCNWTDTNGYPISGYFELREDDGETMKYWLGFDDLSDRFGIFGAGPDGSLYSFWIDDAGEQKIVHLGSEGDQLYILANNFIDFLRLLAMGYDEIGHADLNQTVRDWNIAIGEEAGEGINPKFQKWVEDTYQVTLPLKGNEIVNLENESFSKWIDLQIEKYSK